MSELAETLLRKLFLYGAECKYFRLYWPYGFCPNYSTLFNSAIVEHQSVFHRQYINKWVWLCSNEMLCIKTVGVWIWPVGCCLLFPSLEHCLLFTHEETKTQRDFKKFVAVTDQLEVGHNISKSCIRFIYLFIYFLTSSFLWAKNNPHVASEASRKKRKTSPLFWYFLT